MEVSRIMWENEEINEIYHYTSPNGLYGILNSRSFRFTDCQFFNDKSEYLYIKQPCQAAIDRIKAHLHNKDLIAPIKYWIDDSYETTEPSNIRYRYYVFCLSQDTDSLSLWNYYVKNNMYSGYNLAIDINKLVTSMKGIETEECKIFHGAVLYSYNKQEKYIYDKIRNIDNKLLQIRRESSYSDYIYSFLQEAQDEIIKEIEMIRFFIKHISFENEHEYRFVLKAPINIDNNKIILNHYVNNGIITPYCEMKVDFSCLNSIRLSPTTESKLASDGIKLFMQKNNYNNIQIKDSLIPIRF